MATLPTFILEADLAADGLFSTNWTPFLEAVENVGLSRGSAVDDFGPRRLRMILNNNDSRFSPKHALGPYFGTLERGKLVRLKVKVAAPAINQLLKNPSFGKDLMGWTVTYFGGGSTVRSGVLAHHGEFSLLAIESTVGGYTVETTASLTPSQAAYTGSIWIRPSSGTSGPERIRLKLTETGGAAGDATTTGPYQTMTGGPSATAIWRRYEITRTIVEADRTGIKLTVEREDADRPVQQIIAFDAAQIELGSEATLYTDGDSPGAVWSGTSHASVSSRGADPEFTKFVGELETFKVTRKDNVGEAQFEATGFLETALRTNISAGPFMRERADVILQRVLDVLEAGVAERVFGLEGELWVDPADRNGGNAWTVVEGTLTEEFDSGEAGPDPVLFTALEGDNTTAWVADGPGNTFEGYVNLFGALTVNKNYNFTTWILGVAGSIGETVRININTDGAGGAIGQADTVLTALWQRVRVTGLVPSDATFVRFTATVGPTVWGADTDSFVMDGFHASPSFSSKGLIDAPTFSGTKWATEIEYDDTYRQSAGVLLRRLAASAGGYLYEGPDGAFIFEDYSQRDPAVVSVPKLRLCGSHDQGGVPYKVESYEQPTTSQAGTVRVGSFGDLVSIPSDVEASLAKVAFNLSGTFPIVIASDEQRTFFCRHNSSAGEGGQMIVRRPFGFVLNLGGWTTVDTMQTPLAICYGRASDLIVKDDGGGNNVFVGMVGGESLQFRSNDRSYVDSGSGDPLMELEMPSQGYKTQAMQDLADWAQAKYNNGPARLSVSISGLSQEHQLEIFGRDVGTPVWVNHIASGQQGGFGLDHLFYVEGTSFSYRKGGKPIVRLQLEES